MSSFLLHYLSLTISLSSCSLLFTSISTSFSTCSSTKSESLYNKSRAEKLVWVCALECVCNCVNVLLMRPGTLEVKKPEDDLWCKSKDNLDQWPHANDITSALVIRLTTVTAAT